MTDTTNITICHGLNCASADLIEAHIIPKGFARFIRQNHHNVILTKDKTRITPQLGESDWKILCADCDRALGVYDEALLNAAKQFRRLHKNIGAVWALPTIRPESFTKGALAILWRASLSQRGDFRTFTLGRYESDVRDILFGGASFADKPDISLLVQRYTSKHFDTTKFYTNPSLAPFMGLSAGGLTLAGFRFLAKFDPLPLNQTFAPFDVACSGMLHDASRL